MTKPIESRLGCAPTGERDIKTHPFFESVDWEALEAKEIPPPFKPRVKGGMDASNFDKEFTDEPVGLTPIDREAVEQIDQGEFEGFDFVNPEFAS